MSPKEGQLLKVLEGSGGIAGGDGDQLLVVHHALVQPPLKLGVLAVQHSGEDARRRLVRLKEGTHRRAEGMVRYQSSVHFTVGSKAKGSAFCHPQLPVYHVNDRFRPTPSAASPRLGQPATK